MKGLTGQEVESGEWKAESEERIWKTGKLRVVEMREWDVIPKTTCFDHDVESTPIYW